MPWENHASPSESIGRYNPYSALSIALSNSTFFSKEIYSMTLVPKLKKVSNCAVHSVYCERRKKAQGFNIYFSNEIDLSHDVQEGVDRMNNEFEECIMTIPEQYSWEYKKFKRSVNKTIYNK